MSVIDFDSNMDMKEFLGYLSGGKEKTKQATAYYLNSIAFKARSEGPKRLEAAGMEIRDPRFVQSRFRVEKADPTDSTESQIARMGSVATNRFTAWAENYGETPVRNRLLGPAARRGDLKNKAEPENRLVRSRKFKRPDDFAEIPERMRIPAMLSIIARNPGKAASGKGAFIIEGGGWVPGLYRFKKNTARERIGGRLRPPVVRVQTFGKSPEPKRKIDWMQILTKHVQDKYSKRLAFLAVQKYLGKK